MLALSSLRRSEIIGLRWSDVDLKKGVIHVNGATVPGEDNKFIRKAETKNVTSRRTVPIIPPLMDALKAVEHRGELVVTYHPATVMNQVNRVCEKAGLPKVGLHGLRHPYVKHTIKIFSLHLNFLQVQFLFFLTITQRGL